MIFSTISVEAAGYADDADMHLAAHFGASFAITTVMYGLTKKMFNLQPDEKYKALIVAIVTSTTIGMMRQVMAAPPGGEVNTNGLVQNTLGNAVAGISIIAFDF